VVFPSAFDVGVGGKKEGIAIGIAIQKSENVGSSIDRLCGSATCRSAGKPRPKERRERERDR
jgi:hypothetical protein